MNMLGLIITMAVTGVAAIYDLKERRVPNKLVFPAICLALVYNLCLFNTDNLIIALIALTMLLIVYFTSEKYIGGGDVKLIVFVTMMAGGEIKIIITYMCLYIIAMLPYYFIKELKTKQKQFVPFAVPLFLGVLTNAILGVI